MNTLLEAFKQLNEEDLVEKVIWSADIGAINDNSFYHFVPSCSNLYSILDQELIYSAKQVSSKADNQFDCFADELYKQSKKQIKYAHVCLTSHSAKVAFQLTRPWGIQFNKEKLLKNLPKLATALEYNQFKQKVEVVYGKVTRKSTKRGLNKGDNAIIRKDTRRLIASTDAMLGGIAKSGNKFYVFLQGDWSGREVSEQTYKYLVDWLKKYNSKFLMKFNPQSAPQDIDGKTNFVVNFLDKTESTSDLKYMSANYIKLWPKSSKKNSAQELNSCRPTVKFFDYDEIYAICACPYLGLPHAGPNSKFNTHVTPLSYSEENLDDETIMSTEVFNDLLDTFNEYETRIYLPYNKDLHFELDSVEAVWLPEVVSIENRMINIKDLFNKFFKITNIKKVDNLNAIAIDSNILNVKIYDSLVALYQLSLQQNFKIDFYKYDDFYETNPNYKISSATKSADKKKKLFQAIDSHTDTKRDHQRYILPTNNLSVIFDLDCGKLSDAGNKNLKLFHMKDDEGNGTLVYTGFNPNGNLTNIPTRVGVETLICGRDENGHFYIKLNVKDQFNELPGGSFNKPPKNNKDVIARAYEKLKMEANITPDQLLTRITLTDRIIYMYEGNKPDKYAKDLTKGTDLAWKCSAYWLATASYAPYITFDDLYQDDYGDRSRWIRVTSILHDPEFLTRYGNIIDLIENQIKAIKVKDRQEKKKS